jgi:hypothetical protein
MSKVDKSYLPPEGKERDEFSAFLKKQFTGHPVVKFFHGKWKELIEWCDNGNQYSEWQQDKGKVVDIRPLLKKRKLHLVVNLMKPLSETIDAKLNLSHSVIGVGNSSEVGDVEGSKIATKLLDFNSTVNGIEALFESFKYDLTRPGIAWFKWTWDTSASGKIRKEKKDGSGVDAVDQDGEVIGTVPSVFNIRQDPTAKDREHMRWLIEYEEVTQDEVLASYDITLEELEKALTAKNPEEGKFAGTNEPIAEKAKDEKTYIIGYYWEKKTKKWPKGRCIHFIDDLFLFAGPNPALGEIPYFCAYFKRLANSFYGTGPLHHVQDLQRALNRMVSMIFEHVEGWRAKMLLPRGSILKEGAFTDGSFELLEYDETRGEPHPANMPELSPQVNAFRDFLAGAFNTVSNVHEVSYSQLPQYSSRAPAALFSMMLEQDNVKIDPLIKRLNTMVVDMARFRLRLMDHYYDQPRMVKVIGKGSTASIEWFKGAQLNGNFDVRLAIGVSLHQSKIIQQRLLLELKTQGILTDNNKIIKLLELGDIEEDLRGDIADESRAIRENQAFINDTYAKPFDQGGVEIYIHDNHILHMDFHTNLYKSEEAQRWASQKRIALDNHIKLHYQKIVEMQQFAAQMKNPGPGGGPQPTAATQGASAPAETMAEGAQTEPEVAARRELEMV